MSNKNYHSDTELLVAIGAGESEAIHVLYKQYYPVLIKWICSKGGKEEDVEDAFQDSVMVLFEKAQDPEFCLTCKLSTYLFAVCKRIWFKKMIRDRSDNGSYLVNPEQEIPQSPTDEDVTDFLAQETRFKKMEIALKELGQPCAGLLKAFYMERKSMKEIADEFHYTSGDNAKTQKYKCLNRLKKLFFAKSIKIKN